MKAKLIKAEASGGKRNELAKVLPLRTPYLVEIFPIYSCNFKCMYCLMAVDREKRGYMSDKNEIDLDLSKKCVDSLAEFPDKVKILRFSGVGEPLLHKDIVEMVRYAYGKVDKIEILTNASLLTKELSDSLIDAGLGKLFISIQGTSGGKYQIVSKINLDFNQFVTNIRYYYEHKKEWQKMHIKIIDCALDGKEDEQKFYEIFGDICDSIGIEYVGAIHSGVDYSKIKLTSLTQYGLDTGKNVKICPQPFFRLHINPDGKVVPCYSWTYPYVMGDCSKQSLYDIWNSRRFNDFRLMMLDGVTSVCTTCADCQIVRHRLFPEDDLSKDVERLRGLYEIK